MYILYFEVVKEIEGDKASDNPSTISAHDSNSEVKTKSQT